MRSLHHVTSISGVAGTGAKEPDLTLTVHLPAERLNVHVTWPSFTTLRLVAATGAPVGPTASTCVTPAKPLPIIVKSVGVLGLAVDPPVLVWTCGAITFAEGLPPLSPGADAL